MPSPVRQEEQVAPQEQNLYITVPYMKGSAFKRYLAPAKCDSLIYTEEDFAPYLDKPLLYSLPPKTTSRGRNSTTVEFKTSQINWEPVLKELRDTVPPNFYQLPRLGNDFYNATDRYLTSCVEKDKKDLAEGYPTEHYWYNEESGNMYQMDKIMGIEFTPEGEQRYTPHSYFIEQFMKSYLQRL